MIGTTIGHYQILGKLGEGGMGVVYKALDTKLNRTVALKFLPDRVQKDSEAKARFLQEAQAAAGLSHPNICVVHGVEEIDGQLFMVMEYVEGGLLTERIPFQKSDDAATIASQIAQALQKAHDKGIVHRDVKADNIMLTADGHVKVMDFGLAKLKGALKLTRTSSTVGTLGYMAPEQIQGGEVDHRSDIFSFGVLFFEMLTGKLPFRGEHEAAMVYSIVNEEPQDILALNPDLSPIVANLIQRCLEKDPSERYQHFDDIIADLKRSQKKTSRVSRSIPAAPVTVESQPSGTPPSKHRALLIGGGVIVVAIIAAAVLFLTTRERSLNPNMTVRTIQMPVSRFQYPGLTANGNYIVFPAEDENHTWDIYWMHKSGGQARRLTTDSSRTPRFRYLSADISPDEGQVAYVRESQTGGPEICVVSSNGGASRRVVALGTSPRWKSDGSRIGYISWTEKYIAVMSVNPDGTDARTEFLDTLSVLGANISFDWSPDGRSIAWIRGFERGVGEVITVDLESNAERQLTFDGKQVDDVDWTEQNEIIFSSSRSGNTNLWVIPATGGEARQVTRGAGPDLGIQVSNDGNTVLYYQYQAIGNVWLAATDGSSEQQITSDERLVACASISPDGRLVLYSMSEDDAGFSATNYYLWAFDRTSGSRRQLTFGPGIISSAYFSPDGSTIAFVSRGVTQEPDSAKVFVMPTSGTVAPRFVRDGAAIRWLNNSELSIVYQASTVRTRLSDMVSVPLGDDSTSALPIGNGNALVYWDSHHDRRGLWVRSDASSNPRRIAQSNESTKIFSGSRFAYLLDPDRVLWRISLPDGKRTKSPVQCTNLRRLGDLEVSPDGKHFVYIRNESRGKLVMLENVWE